MVNYQVLWHDKFDKMILLLMSVCERALSHDSFAINVKSNLAKILQIYR